MIEKLNFPPYGTQDEWINKINELVDAVNILQAQVAILQEHAHPTAKTEPTENVLTKSLRMDKEFAENEYVRLQNELDRTRKALGVAVDALKSAHDYYEYCIQRDKDYGGDDINWDCTAMNMDNDISEALDKITALEQKE